MDGAGSQNPDTGRIHFHGAWHHAEIRTFQPGPAPKLAHLHSSAASIGLH